jgi:hypothetical protein
MWERKKGHPYFLLLSQKECYTYLGSRRTELGNTKKLFNILSHTKFNVSRQCKLLQQAYLKLALT